MHHTPLAPQAAEVPARRTPLSRLLARVWTPASRTPVPIPRPLPLFESLEPRVLLSADGILGSGFTALLVDGLSSTAEKLQEVINSDSAFDAKVPGLLRPGGSGETALVIPTVRELLQVANDQNQDGDVPFGATGTLADRFAFVDGRDEALGGTPGLDDVLLQSERALEAIDLGNGGSVKLDEALKVLFVGQIQQFLELYPETYDHDDSFLTPEIARTSAQLQDDFLTFLTGVDVTIPKTLLTPDVTLTGFHTPGIFTDYSFARFFQMALTGETHDSAGDADDSFAYGMNLRLELQDAYLIDLGFGADQAGITLPIPTTIPMSIRRATSTTTSTTISTTAPIRTCWSRPGS